MKRAADEGDRLGAAGATTAAAAVVPWPAASMHDAQAAKRPRRSGNCHVGVESGTPVAAGVPQPQLLLRSQLGTQPQSPQQQQAQRPADHLQSPVTPHVLRAQWFSLAAAQPAAAPITDTQWNRNASAATACAPHTIAATPLVDRTTGLLFGTQGINDARAEDALAEPMDQQPGGLRRSNSCPLMDSLLASPLVPRGAGGTPQERQ